MIKHIKASNILSFGPDGLDLELKPLNVLIGANGSGKSNFLELIDLMRNSPKDIQEPIKRGGGAREWIWKGGDGLWPSVQLVLSSEVNELAVSHKISLEELYHESIFGIFEEDITQISLNEDIYLYYYGPEGVGIAVKSGKDKKKIQKLDPRDVSRDSSVLSQRRDSLFFPELSILSELYSSIRIYRDWNFGRNTSFRRPQPSDQRTDRLEPDFSNLGLFLNRLRRDPKTKRELIKHLQYLYEGISDFEVNIVEGGYVQILFTEGDFSIPASRLSDGTLRYLCLLAILLDPTPPSLICIEEPELGLHPDILPHLTDLLVEASERTQLIITTHSDVIVDALTEYPESILVCEKHNGQTSIHRLESEKIKPWLEDYRLGALWSKGEIGGNRW